MTFEETQADLRRSYAGGAPGVFVSGLVWLAAAITAESAGNIAGFGVLFFGGMLIFPVSVLLSRFVLGRRATTPGNPLATVAFQSTITMIGGLFVAYIVLRSAPDFALPAAAVVVGTRYAVFAGVYGSALYYVLGGLMAAVGVVGVIGPQILPVAPAFLAAIAEFVFAPILFLTLRRGVATS